MSLSTTDCWKLLIESSLLTKQHCQQLNVQFAKAHADEKSRNGKRLIQWLVGQNVVSRYQGSLILAGKAGPFIYGEYKIYDRIGSPPLAGTFRAVHTASNHPVILVFLAGDHARDDARWRDLSALFPGLEHPHLVRGYEAVDLGKYRFLVLEDLRGGSLEKKLAAAGKMPVAEACRLAQGTALALAYLHDQGQVHGDVRPGNLWLERDGNIKLYLNPTSRLQAAEAPAPSSDDEQSLRRADYLAPELRSLRQAGSPQADIYALGCSLFELCVGHPPFGGGTLSDKHRRHASEPIPELRSPLGEILAHMTAKQPAARTPDARTVAGLLQPLAQRSRTRVSPSTPPATEATYLSSLRRVLPSSTAPVLVMPPVSPLAPKAAVPAIQSTDRVAVAKRIAEARARRRRTALMLWGGVLASFCAIAALVYGLNLGTQAAPGHRPPPPSGAGPLQPPREGPENNLITGEQPVVDDGRSLWASPTQGAAIEPRFLPNGAQLVLHVRFNEMVAREEGQRVLRALGPDFDRMFQQWKQAVGVAPSEIEELTIGLYGNDGYFPRVATVVHLRNAVQPEMLLEAWQDPPSREANLITYHAGPHWSYLIPVQGRGQVFVMGHEQEIRQLVESDLAPPLLRREINRLLRVSDADRHVTILFAPSFLFGDGSALFSGPRQKVLQPLRELLRDEIRGAMLSCHFGEDVFYVEVRVELDHPVDRSNLDATLREPLAQIPESVENYIARLNPDPYWRVVAFRYPAMVRALHRQTRFGLEDNQAILNAALPPSAAHNLVFGGEMVMAATPGVAVAQATPPKEGPQTIEELLQTTLSLSFDQESLESAMQDIEKEVLSLHPQLAFPFRILIVGEDLKLDGITRNQQIRGFNRSNEKLADILTAIVMRANPVTTVTSPGEREQKLLWVVSEDPENRPHRIILVTTRQVAEQKYSLPDVFRTGSSSERIE